MRKYSFIDNNGKTWERIDKKTARTAYNNGLTVLFCPVNMRPFGVWGVGCNVNILDDTDIGISERFTRQNSFDRVLNAFEFYNIRDNETGYYTAFYIPVATVRELKQYDYSVVGGGVENETF